MTDCKIDSVSSRVCERGTKCCTIHHETTAVEINKAVAKKLGLKWHEVIKREFELYECACGYTHWLSTGMDKHIRESNPDFCTNAKVLLEELEKRDDYRYFIKHVSSWVVPFKKKEKLFLNIDYVKNPRQLCEEFLRWEKW